MTPRTRQTLVRYGVALDGVILATGISLLLPRPALIATSFFAATAVAVWKAWGGGVAAFVLSTLVLLFAFPGDSQPILVFFYVLACVSMLFGPLAFEKWKARRNDPTRVKARAEGKERARVHAERKASEKRTSARLSPSPKAHYAVNLLSSRVTRKPSRNCVRTVAIGPAVLDRRPRLLLVERRRATADTAVPTLSERGVEIEVVERWVDAVDELFRFKPDALFIDTEHPEAELIRRTIVEQSPATPLIFTGSSASAPFSLHPFRWLSRPYDPAELERLARDAMAHPAEAMAIR